MADSTAHLRARAKRYLPLFMGLMLAAGLAVWASTPPAVRPATAPMTTFSAERASEDIRAIAQRPHPLGSPENSRVRSYLVDRLQRMGLEAYERGPQLGIFQTPKSPRLVVAGQVRNVVGVLPGSDRTAPAILLMSHYDSVPNSPGAADDAAGVATTLEIAANLKATGRLRRDLILLFTDGEESGLLGAQAFFTQDPIAGRVGAVLNMEARGDAGRAILIEASRGDGSMVPLLKSRARAPSANSLLTYLYESESSRTDFSHTLALKLPGLNFAFIGKEVAYHSEISTPADLDLRSVQHMGDQVGPIARSLADAAQLPPRHGPLAFSDLLGHAFVWYPVNAGWVLIAIAAVLVGWAAWRALATRTASVADVAQGAGGLILLMLVNLLVFHTAERWLSPAGDFVARKAALGHMPLILVGCLLLAAGASWIVTTRLAVGASRLWSAIPLGLLGLTSMIGGIDPYGLGLAAAATVVAVVVFGRRGSVVGLWAGSGLAVVVLAIAVQTWAPACGPAVTWPLLAASISMAATVALPGRPASLWLVSAVSILAAAQLLEWAGGLVVMVGPGSLSLVGPLAGLAAFVLTPFALWTAQHDQEQLGFAGLGLMGAVLLAAVPIMGSGPGHPTLAEGFYLEDSAAGRQGLATSYPRLDAWTRRLLGPSPRQIDAHPYFEKPLWFAPARATALALPILKIGHGPAGDGRHVKIAAAATNGGRALRLLVRPSEDTSALRINGQAVGYVARKGAWSEIVYEAAGPQLELDFEISDHGFVDVALTERRDSWPAGLRVPPRPRELARSTYSDTTQILRSARFSW